MVKLVDILTRFGKKNASDTEQNKAGQGGGQRLTHNLKVEIDEELIEVYRGTDSPPLEAGATSGSPSRLSTIAASRASR